jgi:hypothetical protein
LREDALVVLPLIIAACCLIGGSVHTPSGAPIARATVKLRGPTNVATTTDAKGNFAVQAPPGRYDLTVTAAGFATVTVNTGEVGEGARVDVVLEPNDSPRLRTIGEVTVNGGLSSNIQTPARRRRRRSSRCADRIRPKLW